VRWLTSFILVVSLLGGGELPLALVKAESAAGKAVAKAGGAASNVKPHSGGANTTPTLKSVTSWADKGIAPDLNPGRWVQLGEATTSNFWRTGLPGPKVTFNPLALEGSKVPFSNSVTGQVPASSLQWPSGWEKWKGILGQRQIMGGGQ
jgi:hypothetical protein